MTNYTKLKRALQKLGFKPSKRYDNCVVMTNETYDLTIIRYDREGINYHANRKADGMPVFWQQSAAKGIEMYTGNNQYHYDTSTPSDDSIDAAIGWAVYMADAGVEANTWPTS